MPSTERITHEHPGLEYESFRSQAFALSYTTRADADKKIPGRNLSLNLREGSFSLKPELDGTLHSLCDSLQIQVPHRDQDIPKFVRNCLFTVDEETGQENPHFENEVIPVLFPDGDLAAHKVRKFLSSAQAPDKSDQCCEIKGVMDGKEESVHLHGPYQADNKARLTLLALVGYEPAQALLSKLVEKQPELQGKPLEQTVLAVSNTIVERKSQQEAEHSSHDHNHEHHEHDEPIETIPKRLEKFSSTEIIPSHELGVWGQSLKTVTDATLSLVLMQDQMDAKTKKELENTVSYRLGFSPDPRHLLPEEVMLNRACDNAITEHLKQKQDLIKGVPPEQLAQALLLMRSVQFGEEEMHHLTEALNSINPDALQQPSSLEELQPTLAYKLKLGENDINFSYSHILQVISLSMSLQSQKEGQSFTPEDQRVMQLSSMFSEFGFTLSNFRSDANPYIQEHPYLLKPGQPLQGFEQAASRNNPNALQAFKGLDAHSRGKDMMGLHGTIKMENGKLVQDLCPDHTQQVTEQLQQVEQMTQQLTQQFMQAKMEMPLPQIPQPPVAPLYPPPYLYGSPDPNRFGGMPLYLSSPMGMPMGGHSAPSSSMFGGRSEGSGQNNNNRSNQDARSTDSGSHNYGNNHPSKGSHESKKPRLAKDQQRVVSSESPRPRQSQPARRVLIHEVTSGGKSPSFLESIAITKRPQDASGRVFITRDGDDQPSSSLTLVREVPSGGMEKASLRSALTTKAPEQAARTAYINRADLAPLTLIKNTSSGGVDRSTLHSIPTTSRPEEAARVAYINNDSESAPLTFVQTVKSGGKPKEVVASIKKTSNPSQAARTEYVNDGIARTFIKRIKSGGGNSSLVNNGPTTNNPSEATSIAHINSEADRPSISPTPIRSYRPVVSDIVSSAQPSYADSNPSVEPITPRFTTSNVDTGPRNPSPTKPNPNRSLNNGEYVSQASRKPIEIPSITIGTNLSKAFEKVQEKAKEETTVSTQTAQNQQEEQIASELGGTQQENTQKKVSKKTEAGESFGTSATNEAVEQSASSATSASTQEAQDKSESTQVNTAPAVTQTRQTRGSSSNVTEAARITEVETPRGKVKIIEGGRTTRVSGNVPQRTQSSSQSSDDEVVAIAVKGTDEQHEEDGTSDTQVIAQKQTATPVVTVSNAVKVKQTGQTTAASLSLSVNHEYLDFTNPHGVGDAFKKAWSQALAA